MNLRDMPRLLKLMFKGLIDQPTMLEDQLLALGRLLTNDIKSRSHVHSLEEVEFRIFSQWGDDGIIQWLAHNLDFPNHTFIEFGVSDYRESNTRFLMMNSNWSGLVMDGSSLNVAKIVNAGYFWRHDLQARAAFIDSENINNLITSANLAPELGILHIDLDGNDYWIWREITVISPVVVIMEYNAVFGSDRPITVPYDKTFDRTKAHYSNLYFGASLPALRHLAMEKGYSFIGCNSAGNNAYFVRSDKLNAVVKEMTLESGYVLSKFREGRSRDGSLSHARGRDRLEVMRGMPVYNVATGEVEKL